MRTFYVIIQNAVGQRREYTVSARTQASALKQCQDRANEQQLSTIADPLWRPITIEALS